MDNRADCCKEGNSLEPQSSTFSMVATTADCIQEHILDNAMMTFDMITNADDVAEYIHQECIA